MTKKMVLLALLLVASPLVAQQAKPICTQSRTSGVLSKSVTSSTADSGTIVTVYVSRDSQVDTCTKTNRLASGTVVVPPKPPVDTVKPPVVDTVRPPVVAFGCTATDLLCEDFEQGWYDKNCDVARQPGQGGLAGQRGWCGTIYNGGHTAGCEPFVGDGCARPITPAGAYRCGNVGVKSNCAGSTGPMTGGTTGNMASKELSKPVTELTVAFYTKPLTGYSFGAEKMLTFNDGKADGAGIRFGNLSWNCASSASSIGQVTMGFPVPMDVCQRSNEGPLGFKIDSGNWYYYRVHYKLSSPGASNGVYELWIDNCGPTGTTCPATPTLRIRRADVNNNRASANELIRVLWFEAWSNPVSRGERYWDRIRAVEGNVALGF